MASISFVIVAYKSADDIAQCLEGLSTQIKSGDEVVIVDNYGEPELKELATRYSAAGTLTQLIVSKKNDGFAGGCNEGAEQARGDLLVFLNPDTVPQSGFVEAIRSPADTQSWAAWQGLVLHSGCKKVNSAGNILHFTGIAWAGHDESPLERAPTKPTEVPSLSGACFAVPRSTWDAVGGFPEGFFMYQEDLDLSLRLRLAGGKLGIAPHAVVEHHYEFDKSFSKWHYLERNRIATLVRCFPTRILALTLPCLLATEVAVIIVAWRGGWLREKISGYSWLVRNLSSLLKQRRQLQSTSVISAREFASTLTAEINSPHLRAAQNPIVNLVLKFYWTCACLFLGASNHQRNANNHPQMTAGQTQATVIETPLALMTYSKTLDWIWDRIDSRNPGYICVAAVHTVMTYGEDPEFKQAVDNGSFTVPDGRPLVWALRALGHKLPDRVYGPELMARACKRAQENGKRIYLYGGRPDERAIEQLEIKLVERFPNLQVVGARTGPFRPLTEAEVTETSAEINAAKPDIVWVGLGVPRQEKWMHQMRPHLEAPVLVGVGAAFDFHAELIKQAPPWMQRGGLEWLFRFSQEPRRLWRRYLILNPRFVRKFTRQYLDHKRA